ncbi:MAG: CDP-glycerol glycerophosphotransferase family protein [Clostridia bacterium]|nr:CDP-glycerol glycerophosphotransferase family protein [Clostridia bacterium]
MKEFLKRIISYGMRRKVLTLLNHIWVAFCSLLPVRRLVLFYTIRADGKLLDNSKAVYDTLNCKKIIFAHKQPHSKLTKVKAYYNLLTSKVIVTDDYCGYMRAMTLRQGQKLLQIWHGCGAFKKFALDARTDVSPKYERAAHSQYSAAIVSAESCRKVFARAFGIDESRCLALGIPMTDYLIKNASELKNKALSDYPVLKDKTVYLYCPTFREKDGQVCEFDCKINWDNLSKELNDNEIIIVRKHPVENRLFFEKDYKNIIDLTEASTIMLTAAADVVITDYSSVVHDAVLASKPVVFYCPDIEEYGRGFYISYPEELPGPAVTEADRLLETVRETKEKPPVAEIERFRREQLEACDGHSTERVVSMIEKWLKDSR